MGKSVREGTPCSSQIISLEDSVRRLEEQNEKLYRVLREVVKIHVVSDDSWDVEESVTKFLRRKGLK